VSMELFRRKPDRLPTSAAADSFNEVIPLLEENGYNVRKVTKGSWTMPIENDTSQFLLMVTEDPHGVSMETEIASFKAKQPEAKVAPFVRSLMHENADMNFAKLALQYDEESGEERILLQRELQRRPLTLSDAVAREVVSFDDAVEYVFPEVLRQADKYGVVLDRNVREPHIGDVEGGFTQDEDEGPWRLQR